MRLYSDVGRLSMSRECKYSSAIWRMNTKLSCKILGYWYWYVSLLHSVAGIQADLGMHIIFGLTRPTKSGLPQARAYMEFIVGCLWVRECHALGFRAGVRLSRGLGLHPKNARVGGRMSK